MKFWLLFIVTVCSFTVSNGQEITLVSSKTKSPIPNVYVFNQNQSSSAITDSLGKFQLSIFSNTDTLIFQHPSYIITSRNATDLKLVTNVVLPYTSYSLSEFVFTAGREREQIRESPSFMATLNLEQIEREIPQTSADILQQTGNVLIQKSQAGGGSPVLRGFEANKVLLMVDGVRMNNPIYRSGHLQNVISIDNGSVSNVEVVFGPSSVLYGSDALGGVMHFYTKAPKILLSDTAIYNGSAFVRYGTVNNEVTSHFDVSFTKKKWATLTSATVSSFDNLKMGKNRNFNKYPEGFGLSYQFVEHYDDRDTIINNDNPESQISTEYRQISFLQKVVYQANENRNITFNTQYSTTSNIPRYDKLNDYRKGTLRYAEWSYGPQSRLFSSLSLSDSTHRKLADNISLIFAYQNIKESRITRDYSSDLRTIREEQLNIGSLNADFRKLLGKKSKLLYGIESIVTGAESKAFLENIITEEVDPAATRYPNKSLVINSGVYLNHKFSLKTLTWSNGVRYNNNYFNSSFLDTAFYDFPFDKIAFNTSAVSASSGLSIHPQDSWKLGVVLSTGFRTPNIDDYGKVFAKGDYVVVPNVELKPEYSYNAEINATKIVAQSVKTTASVFYTYLTNAIVRKPFTLNGVDSLAYDGEMYRINTNINTDKGMVYGFAINTKAGITDNLKIESSFNYTYGQDITNNEPLAHIPPIFGKVGLSYKIKKLELNSFCYYNGKKTWERYSPSGTDNEDEAIQNVGSPSWAIYNIGATYKLNKSFTANITVQNLLDVYYKPFASGVSAPGRNISFTLKAFI